MKARKNEVSVKFLKERLAQCDEAMERVGFIRKLCEAVEQERRVQINSETRGRLLVDLANEPRLENRTHIIDNFYSRFFSTDCTK